MKPRTTPAAGRCRDSKTEASVHEHISRRGFLRLGLSGGLGLGASGCGTLLYPERRGQPAGPLDWKVVALDAVGLLFFFVPGVIAFAVDFITGAIYLPVDQRNCPSCGAAAHDRAGRLIKVHVGRDRLTASEIEQVVSKHAAREVRLVPGEYRTRTLESIDDFWTARETLADRSSDAPPAD